MSLLFFKRTQDDGALKVCNVRHLASVNDDSPCAARYYLETDSAAMERFFKVLKRASDVDVQGLPSLDITKAQAKKTMIVTNSEQMIIGCIVFTRYQAARHIVIDYLSVLPLFRYQGIARSLIQSVIAKTAATSVSYQDTSLSSMPWMKESRVLSQELLRKVGSFWQDKGRAIIEEAGSKDVATGSWAFDFLPIAHALG